MASSGPWSPTPRRSGANGRPLRNSTPIFGAAGNLASVPHIQDWPAVYEMRRNGLLAPDAIFVPGHSGDFLDGSHVPKTYADNAERTARAVARHHPDTHYSLWDWPRERRAVLRAAMTRRVETLIESHHRRRPSQPQLDPRNCGRRVRVLGLAGATGQVHLQLVRVYDFFGYEWRLPLFDSRVDGLLVARACRPAHRAKALFRIRAPPPDVADHASQHRPFGRHARCHSRDGCAAPAAARRSTCGEVRASPRWREQHEGGSLAWTAIVDADEFRTRYTGREIGHSFFALRYLATCDGRGKRKDRRRIRRAADTMSAVSAANATGGGAGCNRLLRTQLHGRSPPRLPSAPCQVAAPVPASSSAGANASSSLRPCAKTTPASRVGRWPASRAGFRFFRGLWQDPPAGSRYLDVGCGAGTYSRWLAARGLEVIGIDYSQPTLVKARDRTESGRRVLCRRRRSPAICRRECRWRSMPWRAAGNAGVGTSGPRNWRASCATVVSSGSMRSTTTGWRRAGIVRTAS